jgi:N-dimethylarginine dimethylaminohydrolase
MVISRQMQLADQTSNARSGSQLGTYLMCPPDYYNVLYEINPWMDLTNQPDLDLAREQWYNLVSNLESAGATIEIIQPVESLPDMVFIADSGLIDGCRFIMSHFRYPQRRPEAQHAVDWFRKRNYEVIELPLGAEESLESSDIRSFRGCLLAGFGFRTTLSSYTALAQLLQCRVFFIEIVEPRLYHLDTAFCPLDERRAIVTPAAWSRSSCELINKLVPEPLVLELDEALTFCANSIVVGKTVIMPSCPLRVGRILEHWGFTICISPVSEFLKAGGAVHCLTLALDESFSQERGEK